MKRNSNVCKFGNVVQSELSKAIDRMAVKVQGGAVPKRESARAWAKAAVAVSEVRYNAASQAGAYSRHALRMMQVCR